MHSDGLTLVKCVITPSRGKATVLKLFPRPVVSLFRYQSVTSWDDTNTNIVTPNKTPREGQRKLPINI